MITENSNPHKGKIHSFNEDLGTGNIVPTHWYYALLRPCGKSDTTAIAILSELVFLHRYNNTSEFKLNFLYFKYRFNFGLNQVKDAIVRLEKAGLVQRILKTEVCGGRTFNNEMYLVINIQKVFELNEQFNKKKFVQNQRNGPRGSAEISADNIEQNDLNKKSRSNKSNFENNFFDIHSRETKADNPCAGELKFSKEQLSLFRPNIPQNLSAFHPLNKDDVEWLQIRSGRDFDMNFINQLLLKVGSKYPDKKFYSKPSVLNYMSKVLYGEMRDAVKVSNGRFKFAETEASANHISKNAECYVRKIEESIDSTFEASLKRKIAGVFDTELAYSLLAGATYNKSGTSEFTITTASPIVLTDHQTDILTCQVKAVYGEGISNVRMESHLNTVHSFKKPITNSDIQSQLKINSGAGTANQLVLDDSVWGKVRAGLIKYFRNGEGLDVSWFSKLTPVEDKENQKLRLHAPNGSVRDWIKNNYEAVIEQFCAKENYKLTGVYI